MKKNKSSIFRFKHFTVDQTNTTLKVGTDGVLLGAWASFSTAQINVLDVGTGTGVISLMLAQRFKNIYITAIEIDSDASNLAKTNFNNSIWSDRLKCLHIDLNHFEGAFDAIVSNPPFYQNTLQSQNSKLNLAKHTTDNLNFEILIQKASNLLKDKGTFQVIIPYFSFENFEKLALENNLFLEHKTIVSPTLDKEPHRVLLKFKKNKSFNTKVNVNHFSIEKRNRHDYTPEYLELCKDFYLKF